jgi:rare lipoprotein A
MTLAKTITYSVFLSGMAVVASSTMATAEPGSAASYTAAASVQSGKASWYGPGFHGRRTANGERFNTNAYTAAHKTLPFGTKLKVTHAKTGKSVVVRINDRGPYAHGRVIDLSRASARAIGISGVADITFDRL